MAIRNTTDFKKIFVKQYISFSNNLFVDQSLYEFVSDNNTNVFDRMNFNKQLYKYKFCDMYNYNKMRKLFQNKYKTNFFDLIPTILEDIHECLQKVINTIIVDKTNKFAKEQRLIQLFNNNKVHTKICLICQKLNKRFYFMNQVIFDCDHNVCYECWNTIQFNNVVKCPLCNCRITKPIITESVILSCYPEFFDLLTKYATNFLSIMHDIVK